MWKYFVSRCCRIDHFSFRQTNMFLTICLLAFSLRKHDPLWFRAVSLGQEPPPPPPPIGCGFRWRVLLWQCCSLVKMSRSPLSPSLFAQPACVNHIHHGLTGCHSVSLLPGNPSCDTPACSPAITHDKYSEPGPEKHTKTHRFMQEMAGILSSSTNVCVCV